ncbi:MAG: DNA mismatch repair endonuclease MutL [Bacilli bacterium]|nr:DNA mismatch repair endonuclease MutL [Bacilli bacterium]
MSKILVMNENLANKIAAGEVVERVVSVVKELVENSIDAQATEIKIELIDSGVKEINVSDNGVGMDKEDAVLCFSRHATSKLKDEHDLFNIEHLGFRGEALPSIASISKLTLITSNGKIGTEVLIEGGTLVSTKKTSREKGTTIIVKDLFYNTPVRLKYLKNLYTELANVTDYVDKMALAYPNIKFKLINNDKLLLNTDGSGNLLKVISKVYGIEIAKKMIEVNVSNEDYTITGYISYPEETRTTRNIITTFVNNRLIKNQDINRIILDGYHTYIPVSKTPYIVLNIEVDPILIDVNIHPTKMDIKFSKMETLTELLSKTIKEKLEERNLIPELKSYKHKEESISKKLEQLVEKYKEEEKEEVTYEELSLDLDSYETEEEPVIYENKKDRIKKMYPVGLVKGTYIVAENEDGMYIIDQHAAAERINYEKYMKAMGTHDNHMMDLLIPLKIELSNSDYIVLKEKMDKLIDLNFEIEDFGHNTIMVRSHPYWLPEYALSEAIRKIIDIVLSEKEFDPYKFTEKIAITLACKMSIKANDHIEMPAMEDLLDRLRQTDNPFTCPHGRPTIITYSNYELEKLFMRSMES